MMPDQSSAADDYESYVAQQLTCINAINVNTLEITNFFGYQNIKGDAITTGGGMSEANFTDLICRIYSSVDDSGDWRVILEEVRQTLDAHIVFAGRLDTNISSPEYTEMVGPERSSLGDALDLHRDELYKIDPGFRYVISQPEGGNFEYLNNDRENISDSNDKSEWSSFINSELGSVDYHSRYSPLLDGLNFCLAIHNDHDRGAISSLQRQQHRLIFAHMSNAVRLKARPQFLLDENRAAVLIDARYRVRKATARAEEIFGTGDGVGVFNHSLKCADSDADIKLNSALTRSLSATVKGSFRGVAYWPRGPPETYPTS